MKIFLFIIPQIIGAVVLYLLYGYLFASYEELYAWLAFGAVSFFYVAYFFYDLHALVKQRRALKNFDW